VSIALRSTESLELNARSSAEATRTTRITVDLIVYTGAGGRDPATGRQIS
jgi:hypothetical protein